MKRSGQTRRWSVGRLCAAVGCGVLVGTTVLWALWSARLQAGNADQLADGDLFTSLNVFRQATFPGAHSFLLKWPLFVLLGHVPNQAGWLIGLTVACALAFVLAIAAVVWRLERRPAVRGLWCLVLASMLLLVPAQPSPGALLPVNPAMLTTRNLEYVAYLAMLALLLRSRRWWQPGSALAVVLGGILIASDKLFAPLVLVPVLLVSIIALWCQKGAWTGRPAVRWTVLAAAAVVVGYGLLLAINAAHVTHIANGDNSSPYGWKLSPHALALGGAYALVSMLTLAGGNPASGHLALVGLPRAVLQALCVPYALNALLLVISVILAVWGLTRRLPLAPRRTFLWCLALAGLGALALYVSTDHYYPADSRYLVTTWLAVMLLAVDQLSRLRLWRPVLLIAGLILLANLPLAIRQSHHQYVAAQAAQAGQQQFTRQVADVVQKQHLHVLAGDYWDVLPVQARTGRNLTVLPLSDCSHPQPALGSAAWRSIQPHTAVGYLLDNTPPPTGFPTCSPKVVSQLFGSPAHSVKVNDRAQLYIYVRGLKGLTHHAPRVTPPLSGYASCPKGNLLTVVAHEDDDLLFMNPDLQHAIRRGSCITSVYVTAGDAGWDRQYARDRAAGSQAAYAQMYRLPNIWAHATRLVQGKQVQIATLRGAPNLQLIYFDLPDGDQRGEGFAATHYTSLADLRSGRISTIATDDNSMTYTAAQLIASLQRIMNTIRPTEVHTQDYNTNVKDGDHSDHHATGYFTKQAFARYRGHARLYSYAGYPDRLLPANIGPLDLQQKKATFYLYAQHDGAACDSDAACQGSAYQHYLPRQYRRLVMRRDVSQPATGRPRILTSDGQQSCTVTNQPASLRCQ